MVPKIVWFDLITKKKNIPYTRFVRRAGLILTKPCISLYSDPLHNTYRLALHFVSIDIFIRKITANSERRSSHEEEIFTWTERITDFEDT